MVYIQSQCSLNYMVHALLLEGVTFCCVYVSVCWGGRLQNGIYIKCTCELGNYTLAYYKSNQCGLESDCTVEQQRKISEVLVHSQVYSYLEHSNQLCRVKTKFQRCPVMKTDGSID